MLLVRLMESGMRDILRSGRASGRNGRTLAGGFGLLAQRAISALTRRRLGDGHRPITDAGGVGAPIMRQAVTQEVGVVALFEAIQPLMSAARLGAGKRRMRHRLSNLELETKLDGGHPIGVPGARLVFQRDPGIALPQLPQRVAGVLHLGPEPIDPAALFHAGAHLCPQRGVALALAFLTQKSQSPGLHRSRLLGAAGGRAAARIFSRLLACNAAEYREFGERVGSQPVGAVDADT